MNKLVNKGARLAAIMLLLLIGVSGRCFAQAADDSKPAGTVY